MISQTSDPYNYSDFHNNLNTSFPLINNNKTTGSDRNSLHEFLVKLQTSYVPIHGYLSICVCVVGCVWSLLIVAVLTRRHMISPTSFMLTCLAISDMVTMVFYIPYVYRFNLFQTKMEDEFGWMVFCLIYANVSITSHTISIWITVVLAVYRFYCVRVSVCLASSTVEEKPSKRKFFGKGNKSKRSRKNIEGSLNFTNSLGRVTCLFNQLLSNDSLKDEIIYKNKNK